MYEIARKELETSLTNVIDVLNLGERSDSSSATFQFRKDGLAVHAQNSIASYYREVACDVKTAAKANIALVPDLLKGYCRGKETLTLEPNSNGCKVKAKPSFKADLYAIGEPVLVERTEVEGKATKVSAIADNALKALSIVGGFKNRTDKEALNGFLTWRKNHVNLVVADSHHAVSIDIESELKGEGSIKLPMNLLSLVLRVRGSFHQSDNAVIAASEFEYVSVQSLPVKEERAEVEELISQKASVRFTGSREAFNASADAILGTLDETSGVVLDFNEKGITIKAESSSSKAQDLVKGKVKGKSQTVSVSLHHLRDCLGTQQGDEVTFEIRSNALFISSFSGSIKVQSFAALRG